jgi:hypothetical protein
MVAARPSVADLQPLAFALGRYASVIQRSAHGTHGLQVLHEDSTASFVLDLRADGRAEACRGWRYVFTNDGPEIHTDERFREQQGYRGTYARGDGFVDIVLHVDDRVCPAVRDNAGHAPRRSSAMTLRCVLAIPRTGAPLPSPVLLCRWLSPTPPTPEAAAYVVPGFESGDGDGNEGRMVLGSGNGLRIAVTGRPAGARAGDGTAVHIDAAPAPLLVDAWEHPF